jgi:hypothetical protein
MARALPLRVKGRIEIGPGLRGASDDVVRDLVMGHSEGHAPVEAA